MSYKSKVTEDFYSIQGEGKRAGRPSVFIRLFGCNLPSCPGFGQKNPKDPSTWEKCVYMLGEAPKFGCDTPQAVRAEFAQYSPLWDSEEYASHLVTTYGIKKLREIVITGGEPLLHKDFVKDIILQLREVIQGEMHVTIETNGIIPFDIPELRPDIDSIEMTSTITHFLYSVSPKLNSVAGVDENKSINIYSLQNYVNLVQEYPGDELQLKFVYNGTEEAINEIKNILSRMGTVQPDPSDVLLMPVGGQGQDHEIKVKTAEACLANGFGYCARLHTDIWGKVTGK